MACPPGPLADMVVAAGAEVHTWHARRQPGPSVVSETRALGRGLAEYPTSSTCTARRPGWSGGSRPARSASDRLHPARLVVARCDGITRTLAMAWERRAALGHVTVCP